jgi:hypothetical protein
MLGQLRSSLSRAFHKDVGKKLASIGIPCALLLLGLFIIWPKEYWAYDGYFEGIKEGMTEKEVYAVVGKPPGNYRSVSDPEPNPYSPGFFGPYSGPVKERGITRKQLMEIEPYPELHLPNSRIDQQRWSGDNWELYVFFDDKRVVIRHELDKFYPPRSGLLNKVLWYFHQY